MTCSFVAVDFVMGSLQKRQTLRTMPVVPFSLLILTFPFSLYLPVSLRQKALINPISCIATRWPASWISVLGETIGQRQRNP